MGFFKGAPDGGGMESDVPWVSSSGCLGLKKITIPVDDSGATQSVYNVRLHFAEPSGLASQTRVFDVLIQGEKRLTGVEVPTHRKGVTREVKRVKATGAIEITLVPRAKTVTRATAPVLNGIELVRVSITDVAGTTPAALAGETVGKWTWAGAKPLANTVEPGTYDATAHGAEASASDGVASVHDGGTLGKPQGVKDDRFFSFGKIAELQGAAAFAWTFEGVQFNRVGNHILAGSIERGFRAGSLFIIMATAQDSPSGGRLAVRLWGQDNSGAAKAGVTTTFAGLSLQPGKRCDIQVVFDSTRGVPANLAVRVRKHGAKDWGKFRWLANPVAKLNPQYLSLPLSQAVYLGKYSAKSTLASSFTVRGLSLMLPKSN